MHTSQKPTHSPATQRGPITHTHVVRNVTPAQAPAPRPAVVVAPASAPVVRTDSSKTRISVCANYAFKDRDGETRDKPHWNEITIWSDSTRKYVRTYAKPGDLVIARGTVKQGSFEKAGERCYTVDINCDDFSILASKSESSKEGAGEFDETTEAPTAEKKSTRRK